MQRRITYSFIIFLCIGISCDAPKEESFLKQIPAPSIYGIKYAKRFAIQEVNGYKLVYLFGNKKTRDTTSTFVIYTDSLPLITHPKGIFLKTPCQKIAALSSIYARMFYELGAIEHLVAIDNIDYINCEAILRKHKNDSLEEISKGIEIDIEQTIVLKPDIVFSFGMGDWEKDRNKKIEQTKIPIAINLDHLEESPLARAEWIKFFAVFVNRSAMADSIFDQVEKNYFALKAVAQKTTNRPTVFSEIKYSDSWYMPGGKSYIAQLLQDAGATYLWKDNDQFGSLPLSFEQVYARAKDADYWINLSKIKSRNELLAYEKRYAEFKAYKTDQLYNNTRITNKQGYSSYWETGMIFPDRILSDLIQIFHSELKKEIHHDMYYYEQIK